MKKIAIGLIVVVVLVVGALAIAPRVIDWNAYKPEIAAAVRDATGRDMAIDGDIAISLVPSATFSASGIRFSNVAGATPADMAAVARVDGEIALLPLISGRLSVKRLVVVEPKAVLQIDADGRPNWAFAGAQPPAASDDAGGDGAPLEDLALGDVRIEGGAVTFVDARTGQTIEAREIALDATLPGLADPLSLKGSLVLNDEPTTLDFLVATPERLLEGASAKVTAKVAAKHIRFAYDGAAQQKPAPGLNGVFDLDIPSAGRLAAWLDRPLPDGQPDPGPVKAHAVFEADGGAVAIKEATLEGDALKASAVGSLDISGGAPKLVLDVKSEALDIDRYLPPPTGASAASAPKSGKRDDGDILAGLSSEPIDLTLLKSGVADVRIAIAGIKAAGFEVGEILFIGKAADGALTAKLERLALYGGDVSATVQMDAGGEALQIAADAAVKNVDTAALSRAATGGPPPVTGAISAGLTAKGAGVSPRAIMQSLAGKLDVDLGGIDLGDAAPGALSGLRIALDLPGVEKSPSLNGNVVFNRQQATFAATVDPLPQALAADRFSLDATVASKLLNVSYKGAVLKAPTPGLDGVFDASTPSVGRLAAWLGQPLDAAQPDPGPLAARATFAGDGGAVVIKEATIKGDGLNASADGSWSQKGDIASVVLNARAGVIDLDRYLPKSPPAASKAAPAKSQGGPFDALSNEPIDLAALRKIVADIDLTLDGLKTSGQEIGRTVVAVDVKGGVAKLALKELSLPGGSVAGDFSLDGSGGTPAYAVDLTAKDLDLATTFRAAGEGAPPATGKVSATIKASGRGASPRALASATSGEIALDAPKLVISGPKPKRVEQARVRAAFPADGGRSAVKGDLVLDGEKVAFDVVAGSIAEMAVGERFAAKLALDAPSIKASYDGFVQQRPALGLDGKLGADVPSVAKLLDWLGQPLAKGQPDPGPLKLTAIMAAAGPVVELKQADIVGKAIEATAKGRLDASGAKPILTANIDVNQADLDAYLPPPEEGKAKPRKKNAGDPKWSNEPIDFSALSAADGDVVTRLKNVRYRGLAIARGELASVIKNGVMTTTIKDLKLADGAINGVATIDGAAKTPSIKYDVSIADVQARPVLRALSDFDLLSGRTQFKMVGQASGRSEQELVSSLTGAGEMRFLDGAIHGVNLAAVLRQAGALSFDGGEEQSTDFAEFGGTFDIKKGRFANLDLKMLAPLVRLAGKGTSLLPGQTLNFDIDAKLVDTLKGQGGNEAMAGLPIPIHVGGTFDAPTFGIDWKAVFQAIAKDPERLKSLPDSLAGQAKAFGVNLPGLANIGKGGKAGDLLKALPGGKDDSGSPIAPLKDLLGGSKPAKTPDAEKKVSPKKKKADAEKKSKPPAKQAVEDALKGLLKR